MSAPESLRLALRDRYVLERELGRGGMATVHRARDVKHGMALTRGRLGGCGRSLLFLLATSCHSPDSTLPVGGSERIMSVGGRGLHAIEWPGAGTPLVMLHGLGGAAASVHAPVLVLSAPGGWFAEEQHALFPAGTFVSLPGNHWLQISNIDGVSSAILGWLGEHSL